MLFLHMPDQVINAIISERAATFKNSYAPVFKATCNGHPYHAGTITSVLVGGKQILVTAWHVLEKDHDNHCDEENQIFLQVNGEITQIQKFETARLLIGSQQLDIAVILPTEVDCKHIIDIPIPAENITATPIKSGTYLAACGFPETKNKRKDKKLSAAPYGYFGLIAEDEVTHRAGYSTDSHFAIKIDLKRVNYNGQKSIPAPDPCGISGGPVFSVYNFESPHQAAVELVGIVIARDKKKKHLICVKAGLIITVANKLLMPNEDSVHNNES